MLDASARGSGSIAINHNKQPGLPPEVRHPTWTLALTLAARAGLRDFEALHLWADYKAKTTIIVFVIKLFIKSCAGKLVIEIDRITMKCLTPPNREL